MQQSQSSLTIETTGRGFSNLTAAINQFVTQSGIRTGLVVVHLRHTSASLLIQENTDAAVQRDFEGFFARLVPDSPRQYAHFGEGPDDMPAHIRSALTTVNLSIPVANGALALGTWQAVYLWEHRVAPHTREVVLHVIGE